MIYKQHGSKNSLRMSYKESLRYFDSHAGLGTNTVNIGLENYFVELFKPVADDIFIYSNLSYEDLHRPDYGIQDELSFDQKLQYGTVIHFSLETFTVHNKVLVRLLKRFVEKCLMYIYNQSIGIRIVHEDGNQIVFKLPKSLNFIEASKAIEAIHKEWGKLIFEGGLNATFVFNPDKEVFTEE